MAETFLTLDDLVKINNLNLADTDITDLLQDAPLIAALAAEPASNGTNHSYIKETAAPVVGFRLLNTGRENSISQDTLVEIALKILDGSFFIDKAACMKFRKGPEALMQRELNRHLKAMLATAELQLVNGSDADGFDGLLDASTIDALADTAHVINATGSTASTGSSVYLIRTNADGNDVTLISDTDTNFVVSETIEVPKEDMVNGGTYTALYTSVLGWLGLQIGSAYSLARICNLTAQTGKGLTDALIAAALALFPPTRPPNILAMSRRSLSQLQASRTATNATGVPAPFPAEAFGIPIVVTSSILDTEAIVA